MDLASLEQGQRLQKQDRVFTDCVGLFMGVDMDRNIGRTVFGLFKNRNEVGKRSGFYRFSFWNGKFRGKYHSS
jgi:hypothetical protein